MIAFKEEDWDLKTPEPQKVLMKELDEAFHFIESGMAEQDLNAKRFTKVYYIVIKDLSSIRSFMMRKRKAVYKPLDANFK